MGSQGCAQSIMGDQEAIPELSQRMDGTWLSGGQENL